MVAVAVALAVAMAGGCATTEKERLAQEKEDRISAARLGGKFRHEDPLVQMLSPEERVALDRAGMLAEPDPEELAAADTENAAAEDADKSSMDKAGDVMIAVLSVVIPLGMAAAPYLLF